MNFSLGINCYSFFWMNSTLVFQNDNSKIKTVMRISRRNYLQGDNHSIFCINFNFQITSMQMIQTKRSCYCQKLNAWCKRCKSDFLLVRTTYCWQTQNWMVKSVERRAQFIQSHWTRTKTKKWIIMSVDLCECNTKMWCYGLAMMNFYLK